MFHCSQKFYNGRSFDTRGVQNLEGCEDVIRSVMEVMMMSVIKSVKMRFLITSFMFIICRVDKALEV